MPDDRGSQLPDQAARERFVGELGQGFSVIAPAGVGKTRAIVERVVRLALKDGARDEPLLPRLAVVTYTRKAAEEMQTRALQEVMSMGAPAVVGHLNRAFFGTIHGFCLDLLRRHGTAVGVPPTVEMVEDDEVLWYAFLRGTDELAAALPPGEREVFLRHVRLPQIAELAREFRPGQVPAEGLGPGSNDAGSGSEGDAHALGPPPEVDLAPLLAVPPNNRSKGKVEAGQALATAWLERLRAGEPHLPLPEYTWGGKAFQTAWEATFGPLKDWLGDAAFRLAASVAADYRAFRVARGRLTYDDLVELAAELVRHPVAGDLIRGRRLHVILDEAQDTDPRQFEVLTEVARPTEAGDGGTWMDGAGPPPGAGRFCMVGDPQQSIYGNRADLATYQRVHHRLIAEGAAEELDFSVTFRCARKVVDAVNALFPAVLCGSGEPGGQVVFKRLYASAGADAGQVVRAVLEPPPGFRPSRREKEPSHEASAAATAHWLAGLDLADLRARDWSEVAVLCPRKAWLETLDGSLRREGIPTQLLSRAECLGDLPAYAWLTALVTVAAQPEDAFEIAGVLREIYAVSDHDLAELVAWKQQEPAAFPPPATGHALQLLQPTRLDHPAARALDALGEACRGAARLPLRDAVNHLVAAARLRERLAALPGFAPGELVDALDELLLKAATAEAERRSLREFAAALEERFDRVGDTGATRPGQVQLLSCHKAKGLEWDAVIVPFFAREIGGSPPRYPHLMKAETGAEDGGRPVVAIDKAHGRGGLLLASEEAALRELDRLLYVAFTRARYTLVLVDDTALYSGRDDSFWDRLRARPKDANHAAWTALGGELRPGGPRFGQTVPGDGDGGSGVETGAAEAGLTGFAPTATGAADGPRQPELPGLAEDADDPDIVQLDLFADYGGGSSDDPAPPTAPTPASPGDRRGDDEETLSPAALEAALELANAGPARVLPSSLADHAPAGESPAAGAPVGGPAPAHLAGGVEPEAFSGHEFPEEAAPSDAADAARNYGIWWHEMMEHCPWAGGPSAWSEFFEDRLPSCPDRPRGEAEVGLFLASDLARRLGREGMLVRTEVPLLWRDGAGGDATVYEGLIDLAAFDPDAGSWTVVDWKTDLFDPDAAAQMAARYGPQVDVYLRAVGDLFRLPASAFLYATRSALMVEVGAGAV